MKSQSTKLELKKKTKGGRQDLCESVIPEDVDLMCELDDMRHFIGDPDIAEEYLVREGLKKEAKMRRPDTNLTA